MEKIRYRNLNRFFRKRFGTKVYKVGLYGGFTCPNRDGSIGLKGCTFCNPASSRPLNYHDGMTITEQLEAGCRYIRKRHRANHFMAYFQDYTTTYGNPAELERKYRSVLYHPGVVGLALCTRPDCLRNDILDILQKLSGKTFLWVEIGIQSASDRLLKAMNRLHTHSDSISAFRKLREREIHSSAHVILGYPGETGENRRKTASFINDSGALGIKVQNLHVVKNTALEKFCINGDFEAMTLQEYTEMAVDFLEHISPSIVVQRLTGEAPRSLTVAPKWSVNKMAVMNSITKFMSIHNSWQGKALGYPVSALSTPDA